MGYIATNSIIRSAKLSKKNFFKGNYSIVLYSAQIELKCIYHLKEKLR